MTYATGDNSITWNGMVSLTMSSDLVQTGTGTLTLTPMGGQGVLPALVDGTPGLPPNLTFTVSELSAGSSPTVTQTLTDPGAAGEASSYTINLGIPVGAQGADGTNATISGASDLELPSGVSLGSSTAGYTLYYDATHSKWLVSQPMVTSGPYITLAGSFASAYSGNASNYQVATMGLPSLPWAYYPMVSAQIQASGTANTHVDLVCRLNNATTGNQIGYGVGFTGAGPYPITLVPNFASSITGGSTYGQVAANTTATLYLLALQINSTTDSWSTINTNAAFTVTCVPV